MRHFVFPGPPRKQPPAPRITGVPQKVQPEVPNLYYGLLGIIRPLVGCAAANLALRTSVAPAVAGFNLWYGLGSAHTLVATLARDCGSN